MLKNVQCNVNLLGRQLHLIGQRAYATKNTKKKKSETLHYGNKVNSSWQLNKTFEVPVEEQLNAYFLKTELGATYRKWNSVLEKHPELKSLKKKDIINTANTLKKLNYDIESILSKPMMLHQNSLTIANRHVVLQECGFQPISLTLLSKYVAVVNKTVTMLKSFGYIQFDVNVIDHLKSCFTDVDLQMSEQCKEDMEIKLIREHILNNYLRLRLGMNDKNIEKLWQVYGRVRHRSFKSVQHITHVLLEQLEFPKERVIKNAFLLYADPDNVLRIISEIGTIDGHNIREIVYRRPKILMSTCDSLIKTLEYVKLFGIREGAIIRCLEVLTLGPETVFERLKDLNEIEEFQVLGTNPRVLRLVHYQNKARIRLEYLNQLKVRCASLHILSGGSEKFAKFARDGSDRTKGRDVVVYLANVLKGNENEIRDLLSRHPNWCHIPVLQVKQCFDFLRKNKFPISDIFNNCHLLLYPIKRIQEKMNQLRSKDMLEYLKVNISTSYDLSNNEMLTLILYLIEREFHFTGDGIWTDQHLQPVENFNNLLPDFPESQKIYKYGVKPAATNFANNVTESARIAEQQLLQNR